MTHAEFEAELRQQLGDDMVMIPREVLRRLQTLHNDARVANVVTYNSGLVFIDSVDQADDDAAHIAAALDDGTDPETKE